MSASFRFFTPAPRVAFGTGGPAAVRRNALPAFRPSGFHERVLWITWGNCGDVPLSCWLPTTFSTLFPAFHNRAPARDGQRSPGR